jgi:hypothetical protein
MLTRKDFSAILWNTQEVNTTFKEKVIKKQPFSGPGDGEEVTKEVLGTRRNGKK